MSTKEKIIKYFPKGMELPYEICLLCDWLDENGYPISGYFELYADEHKSIEAWFGFDDLVDQFGVFGSGPDGSLFSLWRNPEGKQVIVFLGSEGCENKILTHSAIDFIRLVAIGYDEIGFDDLFKKPTTDEFVNIAFQKWVKSEFKVSIPKCGADINPNWNDDAFDKWIERQVENHG